MQVFLPFPDIKKSVARLDNKRLNKQVLECYQILKALHGQTKGWVNHPATRMCSGYTNFLCIYGLECCNVYTRRYEKKHGLYDLIKSFYDKTKFIEYPKWFGDDRFHKSHRSNLYRKYPEWYFEFESDYNETKAYCWPLEIDGELIMRYKVAGEKNYL